MCRILATKVIFATQVRPRCPRMQKVGAKHRTCHNYGPMRRSRSLVTILCYVGAATLLACTAADDKVPAKDDVPVETAPPVETDPPVEQADPLADELPPMPSSLIWQPWLGDYDGMVERRVVRALVPFGGYQFYYQEGRPRGASYELLQRLETYINKEAGRRNIRIYVIAIPMSRPLHCSTAVPAIRVFSPGR